MKLLLDENLPKRLKSDFPEHEIYTVRDKNWNGLSNGDLLNQMLTENFEALITFDKNLQYQQNFRKFSIPVLVLNAPDNSYLTLKNFLPSIRRTLASSLPNGITIIFTTH